MRVDILDKTDCEKIADCLQGEMLLIWQIGISTGLRISDILNLKAYQLIKSDIRIHEKKTGKRKRIYISVAIRASVKQMIVKRNIQPYEKVFTVSRQTVWRALKRASVKAGVKTNVGTHTMRKSYSKAYIDKGHSIYELQKKLNHHKFQDTIGYITDNKTLGLDEQGKEVKHGRKNRNYSKKTA